MPAAVGMEDQPRGGAWSRRDVRPCLLRNTLPEAWPAVWDGCREGIHAMTAARHPASTQLRGVSGGVPTRTRTSSFAQRFHGCPDYRSAFTTDHRRASTRFERFPELVQCTLLITQFHQPDFSPRSTLHFTTFAAGSDHQRGARLPPDAFGHRMSSVSTAGSCSATRFPGGARTPPQPGWPRFPVLVRRTRTTAGRTKALCADPDAAMTSLAPGW